jgi:putative addiction module antidote
VREGACYNARMNTTLKITKIGNSAGIILPKDVLAHLHSELGDDLTLTTTPRGIELSPPEDDFEEQMQIAREIMRKRRRALAELAK